MSYVEAEGTEGVDGDDLEAADDSAMRAYPGDFTRMFAALRRGDGDAARSLMDIVYADLRKLARRHLAGQRRNAVNTTTLIHDSYLRLVAPAARDLESRAHFMNLASRIMRQLICRYAQRRLLQNRHFAESADELDGAEQPSAEVVEEARRLVTIDQGLAELGQVNERQVRIIECRFFAGLSEEQTAQALNTSVRTVQREWSRARQWLADHMAT